MRASRRAFSPPRHDECCVFSTTFVILRRPKAVSKDAGSAVEEAAQFAAAAGVLQLAQGLGLDLTDAFAGDAELPAGLIADFDQAFERAAR